MIQTIRVISKGSSDPRGQDLLAEIKRTLAINTIKKIRTAKVYRLEGIDTSSAQILANQALFESIDQQAFSKNYIFPDAKNKIEVSYKPGVMNPEVSSIIKSASDLNIKLKAADSSFEYYLWGRITKDELREIIDRLLVNKTVEQVVKRVPKTLLIAPAKGKVRKIAIRSVSEEKLMDLSRDKLFLNLEEMKIIKDYFKKINRDPTDCELEVLAQTWSEHCVHKTFKAKLTIDGKSKEPLFKRIKSTAKNNKQLIVSAFDDNSGVIDFYDGLAINGKVETHNSPSAIEPYGGAMTGSGGVFRDILGTGLGAKPIISTDIFCFAPPDLSEKDIPPGCLPPDYILRKVVAGVRDYGNRVGIPTNNGSIHFHKDFRAKPTVAVGSYGIIPKKYAKKGKPKAGDIIITLGGSTGRDGIHGATFSSAEMTDRTISVSGSAVQIGNAIEEKRLIDAVLALRDQNLIRAITDCGAGGYSSAIGEMAKGTGAIVNLEKVPLKYSNLSPWEIFLSESQERMVIAIAPKNLNKVQKICAANNVPNDVIGKFTGSKKLLVKFKDRVVCNLELEFMHDGLPQRHMVGKTASKKIKNKIPTIKSLNSAVLKVIADPNVASKEPILRMYDHNVQGTAALQPLGGKNLDAPNDGAAVRPVLKKPYGVLTAHGLNPPMNSRDSYWGSIWALTEAVSNYVAIGGDLKNAALVDNFIWPFPDEESLADLDKSVDACVDFANILKMPFVSGKDSLSSTYRYEDGKVLKIPPVLLISVFGSIPNVEKTASADFKSTDSIIVLVGKSDFKNLGGTIYYQTHDGEGQIPKVDLNILPKTLKSVQSAIKSARILSIHDVSEGGLISALSEMCFGGDCGARIDLSVLNTPGVKSGSSQENTPGVGKAKSENTPVVSPEPILFSETPGTFLVEVKNPATAKKLFSGVPHVIIGRTTKDKTIHVNQSSKNLCNLPVDQLKAAWQKPMKEIFHAA